MKQNNQNHPQKPYYRTNWFLISVLFLIPFTAIVIGSSLSAEWVATLDAVLTTPFRRIQNMDLTPMFVFITDLGGPIFTTVGVILIGLFFILKNKDYGTGLWFVLQTALGAGLLNQLLKFIFRRARPLAEYHLVEQGGYSFPSGHSMGSLIFYGGLAFIVYRLTSNKGLHWLVFLLSAILILLIGISRIYLGVHYPTDVIGGFSFGASWLALAIGVYPKWANVVNERRNKRQKS